VHLAAISGDELNGFDDFKRSADYSNYFCAA
jgi:hypothetical protein